ncbi:hypothetical protein [Sphingomonas tagetis]
MIFLGTGPAVASPPQKPAAPSLGIATASSDERWQRVYVAKRKAARKPKDKLAALGPVMSGIATEIARIAGDPEGAFLYVEITQGWVESSVFRRDGKVVRYFDWEEGETDLPDLLFDAWYLESAKKNMRWSVLECVIKGGKFEVKMRYPDEVDVAVEDPERRRAALRAQSGKRRVVYPPAQTPRLSGPVA